MSKKDLDLTSDEGYKAIHAQQAAPEYYCKTSADHARRNHRQKIKEKGFVRFSIRIEPEVKRMFIKLAKRHGSNTSRLIRRFIDIYAEQVGVKS